MSSRYLSFQKVHHIIPVLIGIGDSLEKGLSLGIGREFVIMFEKFHGLEITIIRHLYISDDDTGARQTYLNI